jgi:predicted DNA-binding protein
MNPYLTQNPGLREYLNFSTVVYGMDKNTSLRINTELWRKAKVLAAMRGKTLKSIIEELLAREIEAEELLDEEIDVSEEAINFLERRRIMGEIPFIIVNDKKAVDLVGEGRGD